MSTESDNDGDPRLQEAARWHTRLQSGEADELAFEIWRAEHPLNAVAFAKIHAGTLGWQKEALGPIQKLSLVPVWTRRNFLFGAAVLAVTGALSLLSYLTYFRYRGSASTGVGEDRKLPIDDALSVELNTASSITWYSRKSAVEIELRSGEIFLQLKAGHSPCDLRCGASIVHLTPGDYLARKTNAVLDLLVLRGQARVVNPENKTTEVLSASESAVISDRSVHTRRATLEDQQFRAGWREGALDINGQILSEVVAEYNRYLKKPLRLLDPSIGSIRIGGRFDLHDPGVFLEGLRLGFGLHVTEDEDGIAISR